MRNRQNLQNMFRLLSFLWPNCNSRPVHWAVFRRSRQALSNGALIAKIGVDIAENEPIDFHFVLVDFSFNLHIRIPPHDADAGVRATSQSTSRNKT
jgi:hypothetical protein